VLFRIADLAGPTSAKQARTAAVELSSGRGADDEKSLGVKLLSHIRGIIEPLKLGGRDRILSAELVDYLCDLEESPWTDLYGKPLTQNGLARRLRPYRVRPTTIRTDTGRGKGYEFEPSRTRSPTICPRNRDTVTNPHG
jgi:Protein of unknown function (DUF3631)